MCNNSCAIQRCLKKTVLSCIRSEPHYKPGSVSDDHLSGPAVAGRL